MLCMLNFIFTFVVGLKFYKFEFTDILTEISVTFGLSIISDLKILLDKFPNISVVLLSSSIIEREGESWALIELKWQSESLLSLLFIKETYISFLFLKYQGYLK